jgi:hypothetical protein
VEERTVKHFLEFLRDEWFLIVVLVAILCGRGGDGLQCSVSIDGTPATAPAQ